MDIVGDVLARLQDTRHLDVRSLDFIREVRRPLALLYETLISSLLPTLEKYRRLIIAPHLSWHYFPFHALYDKEAKQYFCDRFEISYTRSLSVLELCCRKNRYKRDTALLFALNDGDLPHADREADLLSKVFLPNARAFKGGESHLGQIGGTGRQWDVIHFACHGWFDQEQPYLSGIDIPPDESAERRTYLSDLFQQRFDCSLATLSACESGLSGISKADELIGLSRGIFYAGAAATMVSLWRVSDESTCGLMENFYWHYAANMRSKTRALQLAIQAVKADLRYAHPYFGAPFIVMGEWR